MRVKDSVVGRMVAGVLVVGMAFAPVAALAQRAGRGANNPVRNIPVTGTAVADFEGNPIENGPTFSGTFDIERFEAVGDQLLAVGQVNGKFSDGKPVNHQAVAIPVQSITASGASGFGGPTGSRSTAEKVVPATYDPSRPPTIIRTQAGTCDILTLVLGPLHLDLLGLVVDLNQINLEITAQQGSGNLLGNLLCAVAGLLDPNGGFGGALTQIAGLLSQIVNILNNILP
jgi:hypothetical protein